MDLGLSGRTAIVCGASSGIGLGVAESLAGERANVVMFAVAFRLMHDLGGRTVVRSLIKERAGSALLSLLLMGILVLEFGSLQILYFEKDAPGANITDASDALWYTIVTISTVGYGDQFPVTNAGRVMGSLVIVVGVGIFGTFTGYLANLFLAPRKAEVEG